MCVCLWLQVPWWWNHEQPVKNYKNIVTGRGSLSFSLLGRSNSFPKTITGENKRETATQVDRGTVSSSSSSSSEAWDLVTMTTIPSLFRLISFFKWKKGEMYTPREPWRAFASFSSLSLSLTHYSERLTCNFRSQMKMTVWNRLRKPTKCCWI